MIAAKLNIRHRQASLATIASELTGIALESWLCPAELEVLSSLRDPRRRESWLAGRRLAKQLILATLQEKESSNNWRGPGSISSADICILSRDASQRGVHPLILLGGRLKPWTLSISHSEKRVGVMLALTEDIRLGMDVTETSNACQRLARVWFTESEWEFVNQATGKNNSVNHTTKLAEQVATIWSAKEAAYKALNEGESFAPRQMEVRPIGTHRWHVVWQIGQTHRECYVHTELSAGSVRALAAVGWTGLSETMN